MWERLLRRLRGEDDVAPGLSEREAEARVRPMKGSAILSVGPQDPPVREA